MVSYERKNDQNLTPLLHSSLQPFLSLLVTTLSSAFDSDRAPEGRGGKNKVFLHTLLCRQPLSPQYRILIRIHKPQIPLLNLYNLMQPTVWLPANRLVISYEIPSIPVFQFRLANPTLKLSLLLSLTPRPPTPADREVPTHGWRLVIVP